METSAKTNIKLPFITLLLLISFPSVNALLFTPALPDIAHFFSISDTTARQTITWFLIGYTFGQLVYGPIANRFGRKPALYTGIAIQILSSRLCVFAGFLHQYPLLIVGRFLLALGSGVGLKMTFTLINDCYDAKFVSQKLSYIMLAFAVMPGLSVFFGGFLHTHFGWQGCFYGGAIYGSILLLFVIALPETHKNLDYNALKLSHLLHSYGEQFKSLMLVSGGLLMGASTAFIYVFAALAPFITMNFFGMTSMQYGSANVLPPIGLIFGSLFNTQLINKFSLRTIIFIGIVIATLGVIMMFIGLLMDLPTLFTFFITNIVINFGLTLVLANSSSIAMGGSGDKAHASAVMNFVNMGTATIIILSLSTLPLTSYLLPMIYLVLCICMMGVYSILLASKK